MKITVFSKEHGFCPRCKMVKKWLKGHKIPFTEKDIEQPKTREFVMKKGFRSAPVVEADHWKVAFSGLNMPKLVKLAKNVKAN